jgi:hypothetical protein
VTGGMADRFGVRGIFDIRLFVQKVEGDGEANEFVLKGANGVADGFEGL